MSQDPRNVLAFLGLTDTPDSYAGYSGRIVAIKADETGLEFVIPTAGSFAGPATSTDNAVVRFDGAGGALVQNSGVIIDDGDNVTGIQHLTLPVDGLRLKDTDASNYLALVVGGDLTLDRTLTITVQDANRAVTIKGDVTVQNVDFSGDVQIYDAGGSSLLMQLTGNTNITLPTSGTVATTSNSLSDFAAPTGDISIDGYKITNVADGVSATDAVNLGQLSAAISGLLVHTNCKYASTTNIGGTYVGSPTFTLTEVGFGALSIDGATPSVGDRVLLKDQTDATQNGIYTVTVVGNGGASYVLTRATDFDSDAEALTGAYAFISAGSTNAGYGFYLTTPATITLDTTGLSFTAFLGAAVYVAGNGLTLSGLTFNVGAGTGITVGGDTVSVDFTAVQAKDPTLDALAALDGTAGFIVETGADTFVRRTLTSLSGITITDGAGTSANPAIGVTINTLTTDSSPDLANDYLMTHDTSANALKKVLLRDVSAGGSAFFRQVGTSPLEFWYGSALTSDTMSTIAMAVTATTSTMYAVPYIEGRGCTLDQMAINVNVAVASTVVRFGIYQATSSTNLYPSTLVVDAGEVSSTTVGTKAQAITATLNKGQLYWFVFIADNTTAVATGPTIRAFPASAMPTVLGTSSAFGTTPNTYLSIAGQTYGALPGTFPAGATPATGAAPAGIVRLSA